MTLRLALVIEGDASGAKKAAGDTAAALDGVAKAARDASAAADQARAKLANGLLDKGSTAQAIDVQLGIGSAAADRSADIAAYGQQLDAVRAKFSPLFAAQQEYKAQLADIKGALKAGAVSQDEYQAAVTDTKVAFVQQVNALRPGRDALAAGGAAAREAAGAHGELATKVALTGNQIAELGHIARSTFGTMLAGGSVFQALGFEANRLVSVLTIGPGGVGGTLKAIAGGIAGLLSPTAAATAGIVTFAAAGTLAAHQYNDGQRQIALALTGTGLAAGALISDINRIGEESATAFGLSVGEARNLASALAATGKVGVAEIEPIVKLGHDIALAYGIDAAQASSLLASSFADPAKGAEELNKRLGFLDAAGLKHIQTLQAENKVYEAQQILTRGVGQALDAMRPQLQTQESFWTAIGNGISNAWDAVGRFAARTTGIGLTQGLDDQIAAAKATIADLQQRIAEATNAPILNRQSTLDRLNRQLDEQKQKLGALDGAWAKYWDQVNGAVGRRDSFVQAGAIRAQLPELSQQEELQRRYMVLKTTLEQVNKSGGEQSPVLARLGLSYDALTRATKGASEALGNWKYNSDRAIAGLQLDIEAVGKRAPQQLGDIARKRTLLNTGSPEQADLAGTLAIRQAQQQITDSQREQLLTAQQRVQSASLELSILGAGSVEQDRQRALLQAKQQLEQDALRTYGNRDAYDKAHLAALEKQIDAEARVKQALAEQQALRELQFQRGQISRSSDEQAVASQLRGIYGDDYQRYMDGSIAQTLRFNQALQQTHDTGLNFFRDLQSGIRQGNGVWDAFANAASNALDRVIQKEFEAVYNEAFSSLFGSGGGGLSGFISSLFGGGATTNTGWSLPQTSAAAVKFDTGGYTGNHPVAAIAGVVHGREYVFDAASTARLGVPFLESLRRGARGYAEGGYVGSLPGWATGGGAAAAAAGPAVSISIKKDPDSDVQAGRPRRNADGRIDIPLTIKRVVSDGFANGEFTDPMNAQVAAPRRMVER